MPKIHLRPALASDLEGLVDLETRAMHFPMGHRVREWFRDDYPGDLRDRFAVAEHEGRLVAAAALVPLAIRYRGVPLQAAYWEAVVTDEAYRRQGLCRRLFESLTPETGFDAFFVWGATWLYRRFGYVPALRSAGLLDSGRRIVRRADLPESSLDVRDAIPDDAPFLPQLRFEAGVRSIVSVPVGETRWRWDLRPDRAVVDRDGTALNQWQRWRILERGGVPVGYLMHDPWGLGCLMEVEIVPQKTTWREAGAAAIRSTAALISPQNDVSTALPSDHPLFVAFPRAFAPASRAYGDVAVRLPNVVAFLRRIAPALETTLAASPLAGWTGSLTLSLISEAIVLRFENGRLTWVEKESVERPDAARARFSPGRFEALVFGYRSLTEILAEDADCATDEETQAILSAIFPSGESFLRPV